MNKEIHIPYLARKRNKSVFIPGKSPECSVYPLTGLEKTLLERKIIIYKFWTVNKKAKNKIKLNCPISLPH